MILIRIGRTPTCGAILLCLCVWGWASKARSPELKDIFCLEAKELSDNGSAEIVSFDITPDNRSIIIGFRLTEPGRKPSAWVAKWELVPARFVTRTRLNEPAEAQTSEDSLMQVRVTADGKFVILQREQSVDILDAGSLSIVRSIPVISSSLQTSGDCRILAVVVDQEKDRIVHIFNVQSGEEISQWAMPTPTRLYYNPTLSPHGNQVLLVSAGAPPDILLVDVMTGRQIRTFSSGYKYLNNGTFGVGAAWFLNDSQFVVVPSTEADPSGRYAGRALKVFAVDTGEVINELTYKRLGPTDDLWVSRTGDGFAMLSAWRSPSQNRRDVDANIPITLLFFQATRSEPTCIIEKFLDPSNASENRVVASRDLNIFAVNVGEKLRVYRVENCEIEIHNTEKPY